MNADGWNELMCPYFRQTCIEVLEGYLARKGLQIDHLEDVGAVIFQKSGFFLEFGYVPESAPAYSPTVVIGLGVRKYDEGGMPTGIPLWFIIPDGDPARKYSLWTFANVEELRATLERIKSHVIETFVMPLWECSGVLERAVVEFRRSF